MEEGEIQIDSIEPIGFPEITPGLARESGFLGVLDLLKIAKHGPGRNVFLIDFYYKSIYASGVLTPKEVELLRIAFDASYTHMYAPGTRRHMKEHLQQAPPRKKSWMC